METRWLESDSRSRVSEEEEEEENENVQGGTCEMEEQSVSRQKELDEG